MKSIFTSLVVIMFTLGVKAQLATPFNFEVGLSDTLWTFFANGPAQAPEDFDIVANPNKMALNMSDSVLYINVRENADPWVGLFTDEVEPMEFTDNKHFLTMLVYKTKISPMSYKLEIPVGGGSAVSVTLPNTLIEEWELLTFDMSVGIGKTWQRLTVFPDFPTTRTDGGIVYLDNFVSPYPTSLEEIGLNVKVYPNPAEDVMFVQFPEMMSLSVSNLLGQTVKTFNFDRVNSKTINVAELKSGIYFITVESATGSFTSKFMKK